jgi:tRNA 5-methylaminomethyl-2-thiouridine biosynthesis bifunctional protein
MKTEPIQPARIDFEEALAPRAIDFDDRYHGHAGAAEQARHVFLGGNELPRRWQGRARFVILETGFGLGHNFLATWAAWRADPARCERLYFLSLDKHPPTRDDLARAHRHGSAEPTLSTQLLQAWPPLTHDLHLLAFEQGRVQLQLAFGDVATWLPDIMATVDAFYLDGFAPAKNAAMWQPHVFKGLARLAAPGATAATWSAARAVQDGLRELGFQVDRVPGIGGKLHTTVARYAPAFSPRRAVNHRVMAEAGGEIAIVGAGLAGTLLGHALAEQGRACVVFDRHPAAATETSGNPAGLFHGIVNPQDGAHAQFNRAAALLAQREHAQWLAGAAVPGHISGVLRLETRIPPAAMRALLAAQALPADYVAALSRDEASALAGIPLPAPAWHFGGGGWLDPRALARQALRHPGVRFEGNRDIRGLRRDGGHWLLLDGEGRPLHRASTVVLANAGGAAALLQAAWPLQSVRGQLSLLPAGTPGLPRPRLPVAGSGYALPLPDGRLLCGATSQPDDREPALRAADHIANLDQLERLCAWRPAVDPAQLDGRVGWRLTADDRLPVLGAVPDLASAPDRLEQPRWVPRAIGLFTLCALGSRGLTWAPLAARTLAAWIDGAPLPVSAGLLDAIDVARFASRAARRGSSRPA